MLAEGVEVGARPAVRLEAQLASGREGGALGRRELLPVAVQVQVLLAVQTRDRESVFLVAQSVQAVVDA
jgi:hypothetical protein